MLSIRSVNKKHCKMYVWKRNDEKTVGLSKYILLVIFDALTLCVILCRCSPQILIQKKKCTRQDGCHQYSLWVAGVRLLCDMPV